MSKKAIIPALVTVIAALVLLTITAGEYQPPLLSSATRHPKEIVFDFFGFGWHYSRYLWLANAQDWKKANRQRLLAFWHRPNWSGFEDLRKKSFFELGCWYERLSLPGHASLILIEACRRNPENRWLRRQAADKIKKMKQGKQLGKSCYLVLEDNPEDR